MNQTTTPADLFRAAIGRHIQSKSGILVINDVLTHKTGVLKSGASAPYLHLVAEQGDLPEVDLHPQKALDLLKNGECGAYKILADLATTGEVSTEVVAAVETAPVAATPAEMIADNTIPAVVVAAAALGMTVETVAEAVAVAGEQGAEEAKPETKKAGTIRLYNAGVAAGLARKDIIAQMRTELNLSAPGANTYYQNCKSGAWK